MPPVTLSRVLFGVVLLGLMLAAANAVGAVPTIIEQGVFWQKWQVIVLVAAQVPVLLAGLGALIHWMFGHYTRRIEVQFDHLLEVRRVENQRVRDMMDTINMRQQAVEEKFLETENNVVKWRMETSENFVRYDVWLEQIGATNIKLDRIKEIVLKELETHHGH